MNYGVLNFIGQPVAWRYGAPLAFVLLWALGKLNEAGVGIKPAPADYLVAAGFVFAATNLLYLNIFVRNLSFEEITRLWVIVVGITLLGISRATRDGLLATAGSLVVAAGLVAAAADRFSFIAGSASRSERLGRAPHGRVRGHRPSTEPAGHPGRPARGGAC